MEPARDRGHPDRPRGGCGMAFCVRIRTFLSDASVSRAGRKILVLCGVLAVGFCAQTALAQRGGAAGAHAGGRGSPARSFGGHSFGGEMRGVAPHRSSGWRSARASGGMEVVLGAPRKTEARGGMVSYSGAPERDESPAIRSYGAAGGRGSERGRFGNGAHGQGFRGARRWGARPSASAEALPPVVPRHTVIGFPPGADGWRMPRSSRSAGTPLRFAGQGGSMWRSSPPPSRTRRADLSSARGSPARGEWSLPINRKDNERRFGRRDHDRDDLFPRYRRRFFSRGSTFLGYPYYPYGLGVWPVCSNGGLDANLDWQWRWNPDDNCYEPAQPESDWLQVYGPDPSYGAPQADTRPIDRPYAEPSPSAFVNDHSSAPPSAAGTPDTLLYFADGTNYAVTSYWLAGGKLHYITSYGAEDAVPIGQIDIQRTVDANAARGVPFTLRPSPGGALQHHG